MQSCQALTGELQLQTWSHGGSTVPEMLNRNCPLDVAVHYLTNTSKTWILDHDNIYREIRYHEEDTTQ